MRNKNKKWEVNRLFKIAEQTVEEAIPTEEVKKRDLSEDFWMELDSQVKLGEIIIIQFWAKPRMAKSTNGITVGQKIWEMLLLHRIRTDGEFNIKNIARDQQEYSKIMMNPDTKNTVIVTDESNELSKTGENSSIDNALNRVFSDVQAGRYVHRVNCCPQEMIDQNADIILECISTDAESMTNLCYLYYRMFKGGFATNILIGYVEIYVGDLIKNWVKVKPIFLKDKRTKKEEKLIEDWRKKDFYIDYMVRKYKKMELITREGIKKPQLLEYAQIILKVVDILKPLARFGNLIDKDTMRNYVRIECRKQRVFTSLIGDELMTKEVNGVLSLYRGFQKISDKEDELRIKIRSIKDKKSRDKVEVLIHNLKNVYEDLKVNISEQIEELKKMVRVYKEYHEEKYTEKGNL